MRSCLTHALEPDRAEVVPHDPSETLALVDLESYEAFVGTGSDRLDLMAHLQRQMQALTVTAWGISPSMLGLRLVLTEDHRALERMAESNQSPSASGWVRTHGGRLGLVGHDRLFECARRSAQDILQTGRKAKSPPPRVIHVPPGLYSVHIFHHLPTGEGMNASSRPASSTSSTAILRHYTFPAPRLAPVRLPGFVPEAASY